jgi:hypothetical protein
MRCRWPISGRAIGLGGSPRPALLLLLLLLTSAADSARRRSRRAAAAGAAASISFSSPFEVRWLASIPVEERCRFVINIY